VPGKSRGSRRHHFLLIRIRVLAVVLAASASVTACSPAEPISKDPYGENFRQALVLASSEFERAALEDLDISRSEYEEAMNLFVQCVAASGVEVTLRDQTGYYVYETVGDGSDFDSAADVCRIGTNGLIEPLYVDKLRNPENLDPQEATLGCLKRSGVVPSEFSVDDMQSLWDSQGKAQASGNPLPANIATIVESPSFNECLSNASMH